MGIRAAVRQELSARPVADGAEGWGARWRRGLQELDERFPALSHWMGGRLDIEVPAILVSVGVHALFLLVLATAGYAVHTDARHEFQGRVAEKAISNELTHGDLQDLDQGPDPPALTAAAGSFSPHLATTTVSSPPAAAVVASAAGNGPAPLEMAALDVRRATEMAVPSAAMLGQTVAIKGNGAEHVGGVEGAVDRIAVEVLRRLEQGRTLVIWAFDASGSLQVERERLSKHIDSVYTHLAQLDEKGLARNDGLLTVVVAFGHDRKADPTEPTADKDEILSAINAVPLDTSGVETTFQTVAEVVRRWGRYKDAQSHVYHAMVIVVTDEVGDDESHLEEAIDVANKAKVPVYVLGSQAIFGRVEGYMDYTDPKTKRVFRHLPVRQGPESVMLEQIRLPFWYDGPQYDTLDAGFGPYALSRLAGATGGIYFVTRLGERRMGFDPVMMREYKPDWVSRGQYEANLARNPIRQAVLEAAQITQQNLPGQPPLHFPAADGPEFKEAMAKAQEVAARTAYTVDAALEPILRVAKARDRETSRRWQAHYDLVLGRLLAMKIRCYEYNWACAKMKKDAPKFQKPDANAWKLVPDEEIHYSDKAAAAAVEAKSLLKRVVEEHPSTPWALLAQRELKDPFGFKWVETYVKPVVRDNQAAAEAKKKKAMPRPADAKPAEVPNSEPPHVTSRGRSIMELRVPPPSSADSPYEPAQAQDVPPPIEPAPGPAPAPAPAAAENGTAAEAPAAAAKEEAEPAAATAEAAAAAKAARVKKRRRRRAQVDAPAWAVSLVVHVVVLTILGLATFSSEVQKAVANINSALVANPTGADEMVHIYADPSNAPREQAVGSEGSATGSEQAGGGSSFAGIGSGPPSATPRVAGVGRGIGEKTSLPGVKVVANVSGLGMLPSAARLGVDLGGGGMIGGDVTYETSDVGVALDQLAPQILRHLGQHKLTVVWLFDESESMKDDQKAIREKFDRVASELKVNVDSVAKKPANAASVPLTHAIVGFGNDLHYELEKPTPNVDLIGQAIEHLKIDDTGTENTMHALQEVINHYSVLIKKDRRLLIVLVTDESGDDGSYVEEAHQAVLEHKVPIYVIGRQSLFGYERAHLRYVDPVTKDVYWPVIRRGPETADMELLQWDGLHNRWDEQASGFAPYELARLAKDSGGIYFLLPSEENMRVRRQERAYSIATLKEYIPEYDNRIEYVERRNKSEFRSTLYDIIQVTRSFPFRYYFPIEPAEMIPAANEAGMIATERLKVLLAIQNRLESLQKLRDREPMKRWQAHYDLMLAQIVSYQVKAYEYRACLAEMVKTVPQPKRQPTPNVIVVWELRHARAPKAPKEETAKKYAEAEKLLRLVIERHPKTPWADLAQDELNRGLSVQRTEWVHSPRYNERQKLVPKY